MTGHIEGIVGVEEIATPAAILAAVMGPQVDILETIAEAAYRYRVSLEAMGWPYEIVNAMSYKMLADLTEKALK